MPWEKKAIGEISLNRSKDIIMEFLILFCIMLSGIYAFPNYYSASEPVQIGENRLLPSGDHVTHNPIIINSNSEFSNQGFPGHGTSISPYLIEGLQITSDSKCIDISDTTVEFEIRDCILSGNSFAIIFSNVMLGRIKNCTIETNFTGIFIHESSHLVLTDNILNGSGNGISISNSDNCYLSDNIVTTSYIGDILYSDTKGFSVYESESCTLTRNNATNCYNGFWVSKSNDCTLTENTACHNYEGFVLIGSEHILDQNIATENRHGYEIYNSIHCSITDNIASENSYDGLKLDSSIGCTISGNVFIENGIVISGNLSCLIHDISDNTVNGKPLGYFHSLESSIVNGAQYGQIIIINCSEVTLKNADIYSASIGIQVVLCSGCVLVNNIVANCSTEGIYFLSTDDSILANNTAIGNSYGFDLVSSTNCTIISNNLTRNAIGIYFSSSLDCTIKQNKLTRCGVLILGSLPEQIHDISDNTVNDKPLGYFVNSKSTTINGLQYGQVILVNCSEILVKEGLFIDASIGVQLSFCTGCSLINNTAIGGRYGFSLYNATGSTLIENIANDNSYYGFHLGLSDDSILSDNTGAMCGFSGFDIDYSDTCTMTNNTSSNNSRQGFNIMDSANCILIDNKASYCKSGGFFLGWVNSSSLIDNSADYCGFAGYSTLSCETLVFTDNKATSNEYGFSITHLDSGSFSGNNATSNSIDGFQMLAVDSCTLIDNIAVNNSRYGVYIDTWSSYNRLYLNRIGYNGETNAWDDGISNSWDNGINKGNFWSDYEGSGVYQIAGDAYSIDHYPFLWNDNPAIRDAMLVLEISGVCIIIGVIIIFALKKRNGQ